MVISCIHPVLKAFPEAYAARGAAIEEEDRQGRLDTPVFTCQLCFPGVPMYLNFYEPRYVVHPNPMLMDALDNTIW